MTIAFILFSSLGNSSAGVMLFWVEYLTTDVKNGNKTGMSGMQQHIFAGIVTVTCWLATVVTAQNEVPAPTTNFLMPKLHWAARLSVVGVIDRIVKSGGDVDVRNKKG